MDERKDDRCFRATSEDDDMLGATCLGYFDKEEEPSLMESSNSFGVDEDSVQSEYFSANDETPDLSLDQETPIVSDPDEYLESIAISPRVESVKQEVTSCPKEDEVGVLSNSDDDDGLTVEENLTISDSSRMTPPTTTSASQTPQQQPPVSISSGVKPTEEVANRAQEESSDDEGPSPKTPKLSTESLPVRKETTGKPNKVTVRKTPMNPPPSTKAQTPQEQPRDIPRTYDPVTAKQQNLDGDVKKTVSMLAKAQEEMPMPGDLDNQLDLPSGLVPLYDHQRYGLRWMLWRESVFPGGGILADEMGLGKTIMIIALIMKSKLEGVSEAYNPGEEEAGKRTPCKTTLIVCPPTCLDQWANEIFDKGSNLSVLKYHGKQKTQVKSAVTLAKHDIVLTTYSTISREVKHDSQNPLKRLYWRRIVLDEAHIIRNPKTNASDTICQLEGRHKWAVTGTPVHNYPMDFYSLVKFLRLTPFDDKKTWDSWIGLMQVQQDSACRERLHILAKALILRRTKTEVQEKDGQVDKIPSKTVIVVEVELSEEERQVYEHLLQFSQHILMNYLSKTNATLQGTPIRGGDGSNLKANIAHIFALLIRLRQCAVLPRLIHKMLEDYDEEESYAPLEEFAGLEEDEVISMKNPVFQETYLSSKFKRILADLEQLREDAKGEGRPMDRVVVVSCWIYTLNMLYMQLRRRKFSCVFITGSETVENRAINQNRFNDEDDSCEILLMSLTVGGVGLNLVGGNHVMFLEPHWNPQLELQAQDRVHRFGQKKAVTIKRYISKSTVEESILEVQQDKKELAEGVLDSASKKNNGGGTLSIAQLKRLFN